MTSNNVLTILRSKCHQYCKEAHPNTYDQKKQLKQWRLETCNGVPIKKFKSTYMECCVKWTILHYNNMCLSSLCVSWDFKWNWTSLPW
jgi:hypothetical protein